MGDPREPFKSNLGEHETLQKLRIVIGTKQTCGARKEDQGTKRTREDTGRGDLPRGSPGGSPGVIP